MTETLLLPRDASKRFVGGGLVGWFLAEPRARFGTNERVETKENELTDFRGWRGRYETLKVSKGLVGAGREKGGQTQLEDESVL